MRFIFPALALILPLSAQQDSRLAWAPVPRSRRHGWRPTGRSGNSPNFSRSTRASRTGAKLSSATRYCTPTISRWPPARKRPAASTPTRANGGSCRMDRSGSPSKARSRSSLPKATWCRCLYRTVYSLETIGDKPSLRLEVNIAGAQTMYPIDEKPVPLDGVNFLKVRIEGRGTVTIRANQPYIDFNAVAAGTRSRGALSPTIARWLTSSLAIPRSSGPRPTPTKAISTRNRPSSGSSCSGR